MRNIQKQLTQLNTDLKTCMDDCKEIYTKHVERLQRERDTALIAASQMEDPNNINAQLPPGVEISNKKVSSLVQLLRQRLIVDSPCSPFKSILVRKLQSRRHGRVLAVPKNALLLHLLPAQRLDHAPERVHPKQRADATNHADSRSGMKFSREVG